MKYGGTEAATNEMATDAHEEQSNLRAGQFAQSKSLADFAQARCSGLPPVIGVLKRDA